MSIIRRIVYSHALNDEQFITFLYEEKIWKLLFNWFDFANLTDMSIVHGDI